MLLHHTIDDTIVHAAIIIYGVHIRHTIFSDFICLSYRSPPLPSPKPSFQPQPHTPLCTPGILKQDADILADQNESFYKERESLLTELDANQAKHKEICERYDSALSTISDLEERVESLSKDKSQV